LEILQTILDWLITILIFMVILLGLVLAHEFGHFITAKRAGVKVEEFGVGFPPKIWGKQYGETLYSINAVPLGGFCKMAGEEDPSSPRSLASMRKRTRILILSAGSIMNLLLPLLLFAIAFMVPHDMAVSKLVVAEVSPDSPAFQAGIVPGDTMTGVDGKTVNNLGDYLRFTNLKLGQDITVTVAGTDGTTREATLAPRWQPPPDEGATGITIDIDAYQQYYAVVNVSEPFWRAIPMSFVECGETLVLFKNEILKWIIGATKPQGAGIVGMTQMLGEIRDYGVNPTLKFAAFLSINLGIINLFPLPALDGGRIVFVLLEWIRRGRRVSPETEGKIHLAGFILLLMFFALITYQDILRIINGGSLLN
jgi:regulator of sigma E protease